MTRWPRADHVIVGPEPHLSTCKHCGETLAKPPMPCRISLFVAWTKEFVKLHRACKKREAVAHAG